MATEYPVKMRVTLEPVGRPWVSVDADGQRQVRQLDKVSDFELEFVSKTGQCCLKVEHFKKANDDDSTAVIIKEIGFFGITDPKFIWTGMYYPDYPPHYPDKVSPLTGQGYLGWNGVYQLKFSVPVFTWMHNTLDLGWIYQ